MMTGLTLKNFTVFANAELKFARGLNVIAGENGTGKSHILKAAYSIDAVLSRGVKETVSSIPTKNYLETALANKLRGVFRPEELGRLARRQRGISRCEVSAQLASDDRVEFTFNTRSMVNVSVLMLPKHWQDQRPVFLPTRELLSIYPNFLGLNEVMELPFEETWSDTCRLLERPLSKGKRLDEINELLRPMEELLDGRVVLEGGRFYIRSEAGKLEVHLVAEGLRKLGMIAQLLANGSLMGKSTLFWDEPEANLNPKIIKRVARTILQLCRSGVQVILATHSLFLMRELEILLKEEDFSETPVRFIGLHPRRNEVKIEQGDSFYDMGEIASLHEELTQSDRFMISERS